MKRLRNERLFMDNDAFGNFIIGMKAREDEARRLSDEHLARATTIQGERMKLEQYLYKITQASSVPNGSDKHLAPQGNPQG